MKTLKILIAALILSLQFLIIPVAAYAQATGAGDGAPAINPDLQKTTGLENPLSGITSVSQLYGKIIYAFLGLSGAMALIMFIIGGFTWMTAGGSEEKVKKGRETLLWAVLGLVVIFSSYAVLKTIFEQLLK